MERLKQLKECILTQTQAQMAHLDQVDTKQLGEAIDMIKDLDQAIYYCTIVKSMEQGFPQDRARYYTEGKYRPKDRWMDQRYPDMYRQMERRGGMMYYDGQGGGNNSGSNGGRSSGNSGNSGSGNGGTSYYEHDPRWRDPQYMKDDNYYPPMEMHDYREGKSPIQRKMYMQGKQKHQQKDKQMKELEKYMQELSKDVTEMIRDASPEQKQLLQQKMAALSKMIT